jgi:hypothetical protein
MSDTKESLRRKRQAYRNTFFGDLEHPHPEAERVLEDLRTFCGMTRGGLVVSPKSGMVDSHATVYRAALRDVYLRLVGFLSIDEAHLFQETKHESEPISKTAES